mgnify:CR=1 FL=1
MVGTNIRRLYGLCNKTVNILKLRLGDLHIHTAQDYETTEQVKQISSKIAADSGMYKEGTPFKGSALSTDGYVPDETTKAAVKEKETTAEANEDDDNEGNRQFRRYDIS